MRKLFFILITFVAMSLYTCDDGDIIDFELDFTNTFEVCDGGSDLVFYKVKDNPSESLSLKITNRNLDDILDVDEDGFFEETFNISSTNPLNYRIYSNSELPNDLFCNVIPNSDVNITKDTESTSGTATITSILTEDDNDGIDAELEGQDPNGDGDYTDAQDTDGDGLADYIDIDDDGDNVLTSNENPDPNGDGDLSDAQDTDGDGTPDYLDNDDDGDGILTRDEENDSLDQNPANDSTTTNPDNIGLADYLNSNIANFDSTPLATAYRAHSIQQTYEVTLELSNFDLEVISLDEFSFGFLDDNSTSNTQTITPDFP